LADRGTNEKDKTMDPTACVRKILTSLVRSERDEAVDALEDLAAWLLKGGIIPRVTKISDDEYFVG
jgi:hypothetical protein